MKIVKLEKKPSMQILEVTPIQLGDWHAVYAGDTESQCFAQPLSAWALVEMIDPGVNDGLPTRFQIGMDPGFVTAGAFVQLCAEFGNFCCYASSLDVEKRLADLKNKVRVERELRTKGAARLANGITVRRIEMIEEGAV